MYSLYSCPEDRRLAGTSLPELLVATALGVLVLALALKSNQSALLALLRLEQNQQQRQDGQYALQLLAGSLRRAGQFGCTHLPMAGPGSLVEGESLSFIHGEAGINSDRQEIDPQQQLTALRWRSSGLWQQLSSPAELVLSSCLQWQHLQTSQQNIRLSQHDGYHWLLLAGDARLAIADTERAQGVHAASLQLWLPFTRHYFFTGRDQNRQLWYQDRLAGQPQGPAILLIERVKSLQLRYGVHRQCQPWQLAWYEQASALSAPDWQHLLRVDILLELFPTQPDHHNHILQTSVALSPILPCEVST
ncbi:hypothetical protein HZU77_010885 [Neisseriaceae bacterium TC5R-5]|nr:hypothetical protein [Neisseriaceae bacterium TC5R-5]